MGDPCDSGGKRRKRTHRDELPGGSRLPERVQWLLQGGDTKEAFGPVKEQHALTGGFLYLAYAASDGFPLLPGFGNGRHEVVQLCCCVSHLLRGGVDGAPATDPRTSSSRRAPH